MVLGPQLAGFRKSEERLWLFSGRQAGLCLTPGTASTSLCDQMTQ